MQKWVKMSALLILVAALLVPLSGCGAMDLVDSALGNMISELQSRSPENEQSVFD